MQDLGPEARRRQRGGGLQHWSEGADLQSCDGHTVIWYPGSVSKIRVYHFGLDAWGVRQVFVYFDDLSVISCGTAGETVFVTDRESVDLICCNI